MENHTKYKLLLVDAANTIIHKPELWNRIINVLSQHDIHVDEKILKTHHKLLSEIIHFPDRTDANFYKNFNSELLLSLGILPNETLLDDIYSACTYLPWNSFSDTDILKDLPIKKAVLSNFKTSLNETLDPLFGDTFDFVITSESKGVAKPDIAFYKAIFDYTDALPEEILYIGDSLKLDVIPAQSLGIHSMLIDREDIYKYCKNRILSFHDFNQFI